MIIIDVLKARAHCSVLISFNSVQHHIPSLCLSDSLSICLYVSV